MSNLNGFKRGFPPIGLIKDEDPIKKAKIMESPLETEWFEADNNLEDPSKIIDNNDYVDIDNIQKMSISNEVMSSIDNIRSGLLKRIKKEMPEREVVSVDDFIVLYRGKRIFVGDEDGVRKTCEKVILDDEDLKDDDLVVFYRVSLEKFFG